MKAQHQTKQMLSTPEVAARLGVGYTTACRIMRTLRCVDVAPPGSKYKTLRVSEYTLSSYIRQKTMEPDLLLPYEMKLKVLNKPT